MRQWILGVACAIILGITVLGSGLMPRLWAYYQYNAGSRDCWGAYQGAGDQTGFTEEQKRFVVYIEGSNGTPTIVDTLGPNDVFWLTDIDIAVDTDGNVIVFSGADENVDPGEFLNWGSNQSKNQASAGDTTYVTAPKTITGTFPKVDTTINGTVLVTFRGRTNYSP